MKGAADRGTIVLVVLATFGAGMAAIVPMAFSLALKLDQIAPGRDNLLGSVLGIGYSCALFASPLTGILSDNTRTRWGRRRPFTVGGMLAGLAATPILALADGVPMLTAGWVLSTLGWGTAMASISNFQADRLPPRQRGKVSGITSLAMHVAPVVGIVLVGRVAHQVVWVFVVPAAIGAVLVGAFVLLTKEEDVGERRLLERLTVARVVASFGFDPRAEPDFAWTWLGRSLFFFGLSLTTSYSTFFYAQRLHVPVAEVASVVAVASTLGIVGAALGSVGMGWLSDRLGRRRPFVFCAAVLFAAGNAVMAFGYALPTILAGAFLTSTGIAAFFAVVQAIVLDVLPHRETQAGRFMAILGFSQKIPSALAPFVAPLVLSVAISAPGYNYTALYLTSGVFAIVGGLLILFRAKAVR